MKKRRRRGSLLRRIFVIALLCILAGKGIEKAGESLEELRYKVTAAKKSMEKTVLGEKDTAAEMPVFQTGDSILSLDSGIYSSYAFLVSLEDESVLFEKNAEERMYPASLTKMMTVLVALDSLKEMEETVKLIDSDFNGLIASHASVAGFSPGEEVTVEELLYGVMLPSGADACNAVARRVAGGEENFVKLMNEKAVSLGMNHTHFTNCTGLYDDNHYSTAEDMAKLLYFALQKDTFRGIFISGQFNTAPLDSHADGLHWKSTMVETADTLSFHGGRILGGKTGFTDEAGLCLASLAEVRGKEYILVTAKANGSHSTQPFHIMDALKIYEALGERGEEG